MTDKRFVTCETCKTEDTCRKLRGCGREFSDTDSHSEKVRGTVPRRDRPIDWWAEAKRPTGHSQSEIVKQIVKKPRRS
jgi:hypothetical protein